MKKLFLSLCIGMCMSGTTQAQSDMSEKKPLSKIENRDREEGDLAIAFSRAGLNADEQAAVRKILNDNNERARIVKADHSLDKAEKKEQLDAVYQDRRKQLIDIMGDEKYQKFKESQKERRETPGQ